MEMSQQIPTPKPADLVNAVNAIYHALILAVPTGAVSMTAWKFFKFDVGDISKEYEAILKIVPLLAFGVYIRNWLVIHGLPADIITN